MAKAPKAPALVTPAFKLVFLAVAILTAVSFIGAVLMVILIPHPTGPAAQMIASAATTYKIGFGACAGLLGGKLS